MQATVWERARLARDARFDGQFFVGVRTTGIYCRPICPATAPRPGNVEYFRSAAAAGEAGYRPCLRCRPECAPGTPAWHGTSTTVRRGLRLIAAGALDEGGVETLAERLGVSARHLRRLFTRHLGASPQAVAQTRRLHFAKRLIDDTRLPMQHVALASGYRSVRRFNDAIRNSYGRSPRELRRSGEAQAANGLTLRLAYRRPFDWQALLGYFAMRAMPGVEQVEGGIYRRSIAIEGEQGVLAVRDDPDRDSLLLTVHGFSAPQLFAITERARDLFDVDAPIDNIAAALGEDPSLHRLLDRLPGVRVPGAWDGFELAVRAILGQQVSVKAATTIAGRIAARYGAPLPPQGDDAVRVVFPTAERLRRARLDRLGLVRARADTIRRLAAAVADGQLRLDPLQEPDDLRRSLTEIRGIGEWTAQYVTLRVLKHPDAFPASDLGLLKALEPGRRATPAELAARAEGWRPWRAYAAVLLWNGGG